MPPSGVAIANGIVTAALALNPNLDPIRETLASLERKLHRTLH